MAAYIERQGLPTDPGYLADIVLKLGYDGGGDSHNYTLLDLAVQYLSHSGQPVPEELTRQRSHLEELWLAGRHVPWLELPAPEEPADNIGKYAVRLAHMMEQADSQQPVMFVTAPMRNELSELDKFFDALTARPLKFPVAAVVIGDSLSYDGSVLEAMRRYRAFIGRAGLTGIGPARRIALQKLADPAITRTRRDPQEEFYLITDTDGAVEPGLTDAYIDAFSRPGNESRLIASGRVNYSFLWPDRPRLDDDGNVVVPGDLDGQLAGHFTPEMVAAIDGYISPDDQHRVCINNFAAYQFFTGSDSISQLFRRIHVNPGMLMAGRKCRMLPGPNTCLRGSFLRQLEHLPPEYGYPNDSRHEQLHVSIMWQSILDFDRAGLALGDYGRPSAVIASERGIVGPDNYVVRRHDELPAGILTSGRLLEVWRGEGLQPYKVDIGAVAISAERTVAMAAAAVLRYRQDYQLR